MKIDFKHRCLLFMLVITLVFAGCTPSNEQENASSNTISSEDNTSENLDSLTEEDETDVFEDDGYDEFVDVDDDFVDVDDDFNEDSEEDIYINEIQINNGSKPINTNFLGINGIYHGYTYMKDDFDRVYTEEQAQMEFDRIGKLGVDNVRTYYNSDYAWDSKTKTWNWESDSMTAFYRWINEMQKRNIKIALNAAWNLSGLYSTGSFGAWPGLYVKGDEETTIKNYTSWMVNSLKMMKAHGANNIEYLIMFTEPAAPVDKALSNPASESRDMDTNIDRWLKTTKALHEALKVAGMRNDYLMVGPNDHRMITNSDGTYMSPFFYHTVKESADYMDIFSSHTYFSHTDETFDFLPDVYDLYLGERIDHVKKNTNGRFWIDETNVRTNKDSPWHSLQISTLLERVMHTGVQSVAMWTLVDQQWPNNRTTNNDDFVNGVQLCGILPTLFESSLPRASYYGTSLLTKYFGNYATVYESTCFDYGLYSGTQIDKENNWSTFVTNFNTEGLTIKLNFEKNIGKQIFYRHVFKIDENYKTASAEIIGVDKIISMSGDHLYDELPAGCLAVYTTIKD